MGVVLVPAEAREVLRRLVAAVMSGDEEVRRSELGWLSRCDGSTWLRLDDNARGGGYASPVVGGSAGWLGVDLGEPTGFVAAVTSLHADGRIRQLATVVLAGLPGALTAAALTVRCLDHVPQVRADALDGLRRKVGTDEAQAVLGVLAAGQGRGHAAPVLIAYAAALRGLSDRDDVLRTLRASPDRHARRLAFRISLDAGILPVAGLLAAVAVQPDQLVRRWCAQRLGEVAEPGQLLVLLDSGSVDGRLTALDHLEDADLTPARLESLLLDPSARVREVAQYRYRRRGLDPASVYRSHLSPEFPTPPSRILIASLAGVASLGDHTDVTLIRPRLRDNRAGVRAAATAAFVALAPRNEVLDVLPELLGDPSPRVSSAAARALAAAGAPAAAADDAWRSPQPWSRRAAWRLTRSHRGWQRVEADLRAAADADPELSALGAGGVRSWLEHSAATNWSRPDPGQATTLAALVQTSTIPHGLLKLVAFHAGLPRPADPVPPTTAVAQAAQPDLADRIRKAWWRRKPPAQ